MKIRIYLTKKERIGSSMYCKKKTKTIYIIINFSFSFAPHYPFVNLKSSNKPSLKQHFCLPVKKTVYISPIKYNPTLNNVEPRKNK